MTAIPIKPDRSEITTKDYVADISFMKVGKRYHFEFRNQPELQVGDFVIVETSMMGEQMGEVKGFSPRSELNVRFQIQDILRMATPADLLTRQQWQEKEVPALIECREKASQMGGYKNVKFVAAEYNYSGSHLTFFFTAPDDYRVNTHRLRIALQKQLEGRIEFRQIGPRDVARLQGGFGACGIPRCCSTFLTEFSVISIGMAKAQGISLNPTEITGMCGRLRCCLVYEYQQYVEARRTLPRIRKRVGTPFGEGRVVEIHPMEDAVTVRVGDDVHYVMREDITPLEEYEALKDAAATPCSKSDSGGCDCGAKRPRGSAEELLDEMGIDDYDDEGDQDMIAERRQDTQPTQPQGAERSDRGNRGERRSRGGRNRGRGGGGDNKPQNTAEQSPAPESRSERDDQSNNNPKRKRGGRNRWRNKNRNRNSQRSGSEKPSNDQSE